MPALPPVANTVRVDYDFEIEGDPFGANHMFFHYTGGEPLTQADCDAIAAAAATAAAGNFPAVMTPDKVFTQARAVDLSSDMGVQSVSANLGTGSRSGGRLSPGTCALINYTQARRYRGGKPRNYFPFGSSTDVQTTGLWGSGFVTAYETAVQTVVTAIVQAYGSTTVTTQVNVSYYGPPNVIVTNPVTGRARTVSTRRTTPLSTNISALAGAVKISSQRRRNRAA